MAISPLGNITYINQNTQANVQANAVRSDATLLNIETHKDKLKEIEEVRTPEGTEEINKDAQNHQNAYAKKQKKEEDSDQKDEHQEEAKEQKTHQHLLDVMA